ncbi:MAG: hypothetical protein V1911_00060, partial [Candidatus Micrarchaeota archaeon]
MMLRGRSLGERRRISVLLFSPEERRKPSVRLFPPGKNRGLSVWLFSKIAMLVFLTTVFGITMGFVTLANERAYADSAAVLAMQIRDSVQGLASAQIIGGTSAVPLPVKLPSEAERGDSRDYT